MTSAFGVDHGDISKGVANFKYGRKIEQVKGITAVGKRPKFGEGVRTLERHIETGDKAKTKSLRRIVDEGKTLAGAQNYKQNAHFKADSFGETIENIYAPKKRRR